MEAVLGQICRHPLDHLLGGAVKADVVQAVPDGKIALPLILIAAAGDRHRQEGVLPQLFLRHGGGDGVDGGLPVVLAEQGLIKPQLQKQRRDVQMAVRDRGTGFAEGGEGHAQGGPGQALPVLGARLLKKPVLIGKRPDDVMALPAKAGVAFHPEGRQGQSQQQGQQQGHGPAGRNPVQAVFQFAYSLV